MQQEKIIFIVILAHKQLLFTCTKIHNFAKISSEMKKILVFIINTLICVGVVDAAVRDGNSTSRTRPNRATQSRVATTVLPSKPRTSVISARGNTAKNPRSATQTRPGIQSRNTTSSTKRNVISRAATTAPSMSETRTGAEYENCKKTYFSCMDQFCTLKNDDYRRCSCNDRVFDLIEQRKTLEDANEQLTAFTETLDVVGMTAAQASAMKNASEGENALTSDKSASKALLQAIMNSIRGKDTNVGGKYSDLNSINMSFDTANAFGTSDAGQAIAAYNGLALYNAVYPQCRQAVKNDCTDASLQRAITAYLMAVEQDCNTVQTAIETTQKQLKSAVREGSAMLDLARVENRQKHNSSDLTTCINEIEAAILSEEVCGKNYHRCLDNGEYIDVSTGKPIAGVAQFYKLAELLTFADGVDSAHQKLSTIQRNKTFVNNFVSRVKKFAAPAMDKCVEKADIAWADYLDKALLDIYYAQRAKVNEIKQGCFDFVSSCYINSDKAITTAMQVLTNGNNIVIQPDKIALNTQMCTDYVESCNGMFDGNIIKDYIANQKDTDTRAACRAVVQQCFDKYGGVNYQNFYYPYSGLFNAGEAIDWFTLYDKGCNEYIYTSTNDRKDTICEKDEPECAKCTENGDKSLTKSKYKSICAQQVAEIPACSDKELIEEVFGGFDKYVHVTRKKQGSIILSTSQEVEYTYFTNPDDIPQKILRHPRSSGVATEVYNKILSVLSTQCMNLQGRFIEYTNIDRNIYNFSASGNMCQLPDDISDESTFPITLQKLSDLYGLTANENVCPHNYHETIDTKSWGICSCWENGARRSENGKTAKCVTEYYDKTATENNDSTENKEEMVISTNWKSGKSISYKNQVCIHSMYENNQIKCTDGTEEELLTVPVGI